MIMKPDRGMLERQLETNEQKLKGLKSYLKELDAMCAKHGTEKDDCGDDVIEAEHNIKYYESEIARIKEEMGKLPKKSYPTTGTDSILPQTRKQGIGSVIFSSIGFIAGAIFGSKVKSRGQNRDTTKN
jgi:septal ring factor EnvC (AmiA/AmiB activator)